MGTGLVLARWQRNLLGGIVARQYGLAPEEELQQDQIRKPGPTGGKDTADAERSPDNKTVDDFHKNASVDTRPEDIHHRLGIEPNQAAPGNHTHDGSAGVLLLEGNIISGSKASPSTVLPSIIAALVRLGATDSTT